MSTSTNRCWHCNEPAAYSRSYANGPEYECERCARETAAAERAATLAATSILHTTVRQLLDTLTAEQILELVDHSIVDAGAFTDPWGFDYSPAAWQRGFEKDDRYTPIAAAVS